MATSQLLKRVFRTVLATGNALNAGTSHGGADGFRLETLQKLGNVKVRVGLWSMAHESRGLSRSPRRLPTRVRHGSRCAP